MAYSYYYTPEWIYGNGEDEIQSLPIGRGKYNFSYVNTAEADDYIETFYTTNKWTHSDIQTVTDANISVNYTRNGNTITLETDLSRANNSANLTDFFSDFEVNDTFSLLLENDGYLIIKVTSVPTSPFVAITVVGEIQEERLVPQTNRGTFTSTRLMRYCNEGCVPQFYEKNKQLIRASQLLDFICTFKGEKLRYEQPLEFPRTEIVVNRDDRLYGVLPTEIKDATVELAYRLEVDVALQTIVEQGDDTKNELKRAKFGDFEVELRGEGETHRSYSDILQMYPKIYGLLKEYIYVGTRKVVRT